MHHHPSLLGRLLVAVPMALLAGSSALSQAAEPPGHTSDLKDVAIPDRPLAGQVGGEPFTLKRVNYKPDQKIIELEGKQGQMLFIFIMDDEKPMPGRRIAITTPSEEFRQPHVHVHYD